MSSFNTDKFKVGASVVAYKGKLLGATRDGIKISVDEQTVDISCDQSYGQPVKRVVIGQTITIAMTMLEIDDNLGLLLDSGKITNLALGTDLLKNGGELLLTPVNANDTTGYRFPNAVLEPNSEYSLLSISAHTVKLKFSAVADSNGTVLEKITI